MLYIGAVDGIGIIDTFIDISKVNKWSTDDLNLRLQYIRYNGRREKKMKRRWRSLGDFDSGYLKDMLPAAAAGGQLTAGSLLKYIYIYIRYYYSRIPPLA